MSDIISTNLENLQRRFDDHVKQSRMVEEKLFDKLEEKESRLSETEKNYAVLSESVGNVEDKLKSLSNKSWVVIAMLIGLLIDLLAGKIA